MAVLAATSGYAQTEASRSVGDLNQSVFVMGGRMSASHMGETLNPFTASYEETIIVGAGYQHFVYEPLDALRIGFELGAAARMDSVVTGELWGGVVGRYDGWVVGDTVTISPSLVFGVSAVTDTMGVEAEREAFDELSGKILFYFSPEIALSTVENPQSEVFWRLHHRSGAWNSFGGGGSANATTVGIRTHF